MVSMAIQEEHLTESRKTVPVSVIIPCYNCQETLLRAVDSVLNQSYLPQELILVNDGSSDSTPRIIEQIARHTTDIDIVLANNKNNMGPAATRNKGWELATRPFVAFLDADDSWHERKIEIQYEWMTYHPDVHITGHQTIVLYDTGILTNIPNNWTARPINKQNVLLSNPFSTPTVMLRTDLPLRFDPSHYYAEDFLLWAEAICRGYSVYRLELPLAYLFKPRYGFAGLSSRMWEMEKGELSLYKKVHEQGHINVVIMLVLSFYSLVKYLRRLYISKLASD